jgi:hypothetical protein
VLLSQKTYIEQKGWVQSISKGMPTPMLNTVNLRTAKLNPESESMLPITGTL